MSFIITDWNLNPNRLWFVHLSDSGTLINIDLYYTQDDALNEINQVAIGTVPYGIENKVLLSSFSESNISLFNEELSYHLKVSGLNGDSTKTFQISPFVDLPDIDNGIYRSEMLIQKKAINEINKHTHLTKRREVGIANHVPTLQVGDICRLNSVFRGIDVLTILEEVTISGTQNALINQIGTVEYTDLTYG